MTNLRIKLKATKKRLKTLSPYTKRPKWAILVFIFILALVARTYGLDKIYLRHSVGGVSYSDRHYFSVVVCHIVLANVMFVG